MTLGVVAMSKMPTLLDAHSAHWHNPAAEGVVSPTSTTCRAIRKLRTTRLETSSEIPMMGTLAFPNSAPTCKFQRLDDYGSPVTISSACAHSEVVDVVGDPDSLVVRADSPPRKRMRRLSSRRAKTRRDSDFVFDIYKSDPNDYVDWLPGDFANPSFSRRGRRNITSVRANGENQSDAPGVPCCPVDSTITSMKVDTSDDTQCAQAGITGDGNTFHGCLASLRTKKRRKSRNSSNSTEQRSLSGELSETRTSEMENVKPQSIDDKATCELISRDSLSPSMSTEASPLLSRGSSSLDVIQCQNGGEHCQSSIIVNSFNTESSKAASAVGITVPTCVLGAHTQVVNLDSVAVARGDTGEGGDCHAPQQPHRRTRCVRLNKAKVTATTAGAIVDPRRVPFMSRQATGAAATGPAPVRSESNLPQRDAIISEVHIDNFANHRSSRHNKSMVLCESFMTTTKGVSSPEVTSPEASSATSATSTIESSSGKQPSVEEVVPTLPSAVSGRPMTRAQRSIAFQKGNPLGIYDFGDWGKKSAPPPPPPPQRRRKNSTASSHSNDCVEQTNSQKKKCTTRADATIPYTYISPKCEPQVDILPESDKQWDISLRKTSDPRMRLALRWLYSAIQDKLVGQQYIKSEPNGSFLVDGASSVSSPSGLLSTVQYGQRGGTGLFTGAKHGQHVDPYLAMESKAVESPHSLESKDSCQHRQPGAAAVVVQSDTSDSHNNSSSSYFVRPSSCGQMLHHDHRSCASTAASCGSCVEHRDSSPDNHSTVEVAQATSNDITADNCNVVCTSTATAATTGQRRAAGKRRGKRGTCAAAASRRKASVLDFNSVFKTAAEPGPVLRRFATVSTHLFATPGSSGSDGMNCYTCYDDGSEDSSSRSNCTTTSSTPKSTSFDNSKASVTMSTRSAICIAADSNSGKGTAVYGTVPRHAAVSRSSCSSSSSTAEGSGESGRPKGRLSDECLAEIENRAANSTAADAIVRYATARGDGVARRQRAEMLKAQVGLRWSSLRSNKHSDQNTRSAVGLRPLRNRVCARDLL